MSDALARWERHGGALARAAPVSREEGADILTTEDVLSDIAIQQGMILERRDDNGNANYRLVPRGATPLNDAGDFKLTLEDVETILMNPNPA